MGAAECAACHKPPTYTDVLSGPDVPFLHSAAEVGAEPEYASRSATGMYRTTPLRAHCSILRTSTDGSAKDLFAVVNRYNKVRALGLTESQKEDLVEFLETLPTADLHSRQ